MYKVGPSAVRMRHGIVGPCCVHVAIISSRYTLVSLMCINTLVIAWRGALPYILHPSSVNADQITSLGSH